MRKIKALIIKKVMIRDKTNSIIFIYDINAKYRDKIENLV